MLKRLLAGLAMLAIPAAAGTVQAADTTSSGAYDWSGFYAGLNAGALWDDSDLKNTYASSTVRRTGLQYNTGDVGFTGGGLLGYNWQIDRFVLGLETDFNYGQLSGDIRANYTDGTMSRNTRVSYDTNWFGTLRTRAGIGVDNVLFYGTGGLAYSTLDTKYLVIGGRSDSDSTLRAGWVAGGGIEYAMDKWSLGAEYLYVDLPSYGYELSGTTLRSKDEMDFSFSTVRATLKYHF